MSDSEDKSSKTEFPTEKKISDAVEKGNLPVSREAPILASLLAKWGDAPRNPMPPSDCPLGLLN